MYAICDDLTEIQIRKLPETISLKFRDLSYYRGSLSIKFIVNYSLIGQLNGTMS